MDYGAGKVWEACTIAKERTNILLELNNIRDDGNKYMPPATLAVLLLLIGVSVAIHQFKVPPIMIQLADHVGFSEGEAPLLMSVFMLVCLIFAVPAGTIVERFNVKTILMLSAAIVALGSVIGVVMPSTKILLFSRGIEGFGFLLISIAIPVAAVTHSDPKNIGLVMGVGGVWISVGSILAFNTAPVINFSFGWQGVWWIYTAFTAISLAVFWVSFRQKNKGKTPSRQSNDQGKVKLSSAIRNRNLIFTSIGFMIYNFNLMAMITFFPVHAVTSGLLPVGRASFIASLPMILSLVGSPVIGKLADRIGHKWLYFASISCGGVGAALMFGKSINIIIVGALILGLIGAATPSLMFSSLGKLVHDHRLLAKSNSLVVLFQNTGMFLASLLFGVLAGKLNGNYTIAGLLLLPATLISAILVYATSYKPSTD